MLGDSRKAQEIFHATLREAAVRAARGDLPDEQFWLFRDARWRCLEATRTDLQPESVEMDERDVAPSAESQIQRLDPLEFAIWISADPIAAKRTGAILSRRVRLPGNLDIADLKLSELSHFLAKGRRQLQAWLDSKFPQASKV